MPVAFGPDGKVLALTAEMVVNLWDVSTGKTRCRLKAGSVTSLAFSPDGETVATGSATERTVTWREGARRRRHTYHGLLVLWDSSSGAERAQVFRDHAVSAVAFNPRGGDLATAEGKLVHLWDVRGVVTDKGKLQGTWKLTGLEADGERRTPDATARLVIVGNRMTRMIDGKAQEEGTFHLDANRKPKWIDVTNKAGRATKGTYELAADVFTLCVPYGIDHDKRPEELSARKGVKRVLFHYRREAP